MALQSIELHGVGSEQMHEWIERSNRLQQTASLPLMGTAATFHQVATWRTGFPGRFRWDVDGAPGTTPFAIELNRFSQTKNAI